MEFNSKYLHWKDVENKFRKAFDSEFNNVDSKDKYYISNVAKFNAREYNDVKDITLPIRESGILRHIINSDSNIKPGLNYVETTNARYTVYYKEVDNFKVIDKEVHNYEDRRTNRTTEKNLSRSIEAGNEKRRMSISSPKIQNR